MDNSPRMIYYSFRSGEEISSSLPDYIFPMKFHPARFMKFENLSPENQERMILLNEMMKEIPGFSIRGLWEKWNKEMGEDLSLSYIRRLYLGCAFPGSIYHDGKRYSQVMMMNAHIPIG